MKPLTWRLMEAEDLGAVTTIHHEMEARLGRKLDMPYLLDRPVVLALVGERDGHISHCIYLEAQCEVCIEGNEPLLPEEIEPAETWMLEVLRQYQIRLVRAFVPTQALRINGVKPKKPSPLARILERLRFYREDPRKIAGFYRWLESSEKGT